MNEPIIEVLNNDVISNINKTYNKIIDNYNNIYSKLPQYLNNYIIPYNTVVDLDVSMTDLSIQLQSILFIIESQEENSCKGNLDVELEIDIDVEQNEKDIKVDKIVDNTIVKMMPLFLLCLMMVDNESILHSSTFGKSIRNRFNNNDNNDNINGGKDKLNGLPNINLNKKNIENIDDIDEISSINIPIIELD